MALRPRLAAGLPLSASGALFSVKSSDERVEHQRNNGGHRSATKQIGRVWGWVKFWRLNFLRILKKAE